MQIGDTGQTVGGKIGGFKLPGMERNLKELAFGGQKFMGPEGKGAAIDTTGIFGKGGQMFQFGEGQGLKEFATDTNIGRILLGNKQGTGISLAKAAGIGAGVFSLIASAKTPDEAGRMLVAETGDPFDYERGKELFWSIT